MLLQIDAVKTGKTVTGIYIYTNSSNIYIYIYMYITLESQGVGVSSFTSFGCIQKPEDEGLRQGCGVKEP